MKTHNLGKIFWGIMILQLYVSTVIIPPTQAQQNLNPPKSQLGISMQNSNLDPMKITLNQALVSEQVGGLIHSTLFGGQSSEEGHCITIDDLGNIYIAGSTNSPDFPTTLGVFDPDYDSNDGDSTTQDIYVCKISPDLNNLIYSTYLGTPANDYATGIAVDEYGCVYISGNTEDNNKNLTTNTTKIFNGSNGDYDAFICKLNSIGTNIEYCTLLGGSNADYATGLVIDPFGSIYICGTTFSSNFPVNTSFSYFHDADLHLLKKSAAFVCKVNLNDGNLVYSTVIGGSRFNTATDIVLGTAGSVYLTGNTENATMNFPTTSGAYQENFTSRNNNVFVCKITEDGTNLNYSTLLGGSDFNEANGIAIDNTGNAYICGSTSAYYDHFPTTSDTYDTSFNGGNDAFICKFNDDASSLIYSTLIGGSDDDVAVDIILDALGNAYIMGQTLSSNFPSTSGTRNMHKGNWLNSFVCKLNPNGTTLEYCAELGGESFDRGNAIVLDKHGYAYIIGNTISTDFPTTSNALYEEYQGEMDIFICKIGLHPTGSSIPSYPIIFLGFFCVSALIYLRKKALPT